MTKKHFRKQLRYVDVAQRDDFNKHRLERSTSGRDNSIVDCAEPDVPIKLQPGNVAPSSDFPHKIRLKSGRERGEEGEWEGAGHHWKDVSHAVGWSTPSVTLLTVFVFQLTSTFFLRKIQKVVKLAENPKSTDQMMKYKIGPKL